MPHHVDNASEMEGKQENSIEESVKKSLNGTVASGVGSSLCSREAPRVKFV